MAATNQPGKPPPAVTAAGNAVAGGSGVVGNAATGAGVVVAAVAPGAAVGGTSVRDEGVGGTAVGTTAIRVTGTGAAGVWTTAEGVGDRVAVGVGRTATRVGETGAGVATGVGAAILLRRTVPRDMVVPVDSAGLVTAYRLNDMILFT